MVGRIIIVGAVIAAMFLWSGPLSVPNWAVIGFVFVVLFPLGIVLSVKRMRLESRLARTLWLALTRK
jgi:FtsH-binding integral membrane protein